MHIGQGKRKSKFHGVHNRLKERERYYLWVHISQKKVKASFMGCIIDWKKEKERYILWVHISQGEGKRRFHGVHNSQNERKGIFFGCILVREKGKGIYNGVILSQGEKEIDILGV